MANVSKQVKDLEIKHRKRKAWHKVLGALGCVVVFITTYMLILPAITMERQSDPTADVETAEVWEATFEDVELSGNYAADLLQIAQSQLGYTESTKNFVFRAGEDDQGNPGDEDPDDGIMLIDEQSIAVGTDEQSAETEQATVDETQSAEQTTEPEIQEVEGTVEPEQSTGDAADNEPTTDNNVESETGEPSDEPEVSDGEAEPSEAYSALLDSLNELYAAVKGYTGDANDLVSLYEDAYNTAADLAEQAKALYENGDLTEDEYNALVSLADEIENYIETTVGGLNLVKKGYTRYGAWYGDAYGDWCAMFVSFCLNYAEVPVDVFPQDASCGNWISSLSSLGLYKPATGENAVEYTPQPGDLVFFDWDGDGDADHVGIVAGLSAEASNKLSENERETILSGSIDSLIAMEENAGITLITIEGNSSDRVQTQAYSLSDETIMGYGSVPGYTYEGLENALTKLLEEVKGYGDKASGDALTALCEAAYEKIGYADNAATVLYENSVVTDAQLETLEGVMGEIVEVLTGYGFDPYGVDAAAETTGTLTFSRSGGNNSNRYTASATLSLEVGDTYSLTMSGGSYSSVTSWTVTNTSSSVADATVSGTSVTGTALASGSTTITVTGSYTSGSNWNSTTYTYTATINITVAATDSTTMDFTNTQSITRTYYMTVGNTTTVTISGVGTSSWTIGNSNSSVATATVSQNRNNQTSTLTITAVSVGTCTITGTATYNNTQYNFTINVIVAERDVSSDFTDKRYYHLDIEVDADFTIYYYDAASGSLTFYKPDNVTVTSVTGVIYNTRSLNWAGASSITWTESDWATSGYSFTDYNSADTYDGDTVASVIPVFGKVSSDQGGTRYEIPSARVQNSSGGNNNNQDPMAGQGEGGYAFYDGDTVVLTVTIQYVWNETTYTRTFEVTQLVTHESNTCSSKDSTGTMHGYDIYVESEDITEIAATQIQKVDQYGNPVEGATFAVYATDQDGNYYYKLDQTGTNGQTIYADLSNATYTVDETTGEISDISGAKYYTASTSNGTTTYSEYNSQIADASITPTLVGTTGADGFFTFVYPDTEEYQESGLVGMAMTMNDLKSVYGEYFIMREINVPEGYHVLKGEMHMRIIGVDTTLILTCENEYESGVSTNSVALVLSTGTLYKADPTGQYAATADGTTWGEQEGNTIEYWTKSDSGGITLNGSLFAVVLKKGDNSDDATIDSWYPVYGNDEVGYTVVEYGTGTEFSSQLEAVIYAAQQQIILDGSSDGVVFSITGSGASVGVTLKNLPGDITQYYTYIQKQNASDTDETNDSISAIRSEAEYFVAYYYYTGSSFGSNTTGLDSTNTYRVVSRDKVIENYNGFTIQWGSEIDVTNYENRIYFEKIGEGDSIDSADSYVNDAVFALYSVGTDNSGNLYYIASDGTHIYLEADTDGDNKGDAHTESVSGTSGTYEISYSNPVIDGNGKVTSSDYGVITVTVGNNTYTINPVDVQATHESCSISTTIYGGTGHFLNVDSGTYVMREIYAPEHYSLNTTETQVVVADDGIYVNAGSETDGVSVGKGPGYLTTSLSGSASEGVIDDTLSYIFGALQINTSASMSDVANGNVTWIYTSGSSGITSGGTVDALSNAMVSYWEYTTSGSAVYNYAVNSNQSARTATENSSGVSTSQGEGTQRLFTTVGWSRLYIGQDYIYGLAQLTDENGNLTIDTYTDLTSYGDISGLFSRSTFVVVEDPAQVDIEIDKTGATGIEQLTGAEFYLYYEVTGTDGTTTRYYYSNTEGTTTASWVAGTSSTDDDGKTTWTVPDTATKLTTSSTETGEDGTETTVYSTIHVYGLSSTIGTYYLEEVTAPTGYTLLDGPVTIKINGTTVSIEYGEATYTYNSGTTSGWKVSKKTTTITGSDGTETTVTDEYTSVITVPNGNGERLPETGGMGTSLLYGLAMLLILGASGGLMMRRKRTGYGAGRR